MLKRCFIIISILGFLSSITIAQDTPNPFDLPGETDERTENGVTKRVHSDNPFDLQPLTQDGRQLTSSDVKPEKESRPRLSASDQGGRIGISLLLLIPLALLLTLFRGVFNDFLESAYRDRKFNQFFRRLNSMWVAPNILLYLFFFLSISVFTHLALKYYDYDLFDNTVQSISFLVISIGGYFTLKHTLIYFLGDTFEVKNESIRYSLLILTFNIILGVFLTPINLLLLLGPDSIRGAVLILGLLLCVGVIILLYLRALSVSNRLLMQDTLHFFMYLCTIEIAPLFIVAKLLT